MGVASLVAMLSLGVGLQQLASKRLERTGLFDTVFVRPRQNFPGFGEERMRRRSAPPQESKPLDEAARRQMERLPNVLEVHPEVRFPAEAHYAGATQMAFVAGLAPSARATDALDSMQGSFFSSADAAEAILQMDFARELAESAKQQPSALLGQEIVLRYAARQTSAPAKTTTEGAGSPADSSLLASALGLGFSVRPAEQKLRVVGIIENEEPGAGPGGFGRASVFIPLQLAERLGTAQMSDLRDVMRTPAAGGPAYSNLTVRTTGPSQVPAVEDAIKRMGFQTFSLLDVTRNLRRFFAILDMFLGIFGSLALAVAALGIVNTLVMAILERRREIGILKALGAGNRDIKQLFFAEAGAMGLLGGVFGVLIGWTIGRTINFGANIYLRQQQLPAETIWSVPWWLVAGAVAFSVVVSLAAGLYPAARAARLDPVEALRYE